MEDAIYAVFWEFRFDALNGALLARMKPEAFKQVYGESLPATWNDRMEVTFTFEHTRTATRDADGNVLDESHAAKFGGKIKFFTEVKVKADNDEKKRSQEATLEVGTVQSFSVTPKV